MDTTITSEPSSSGTAVTEPSGQMPEAGNAEASEEVTSTSEAGGEQSTAEGGQQRGEGRRNSSMFRDLTRLRAENRDLRERFSSVEQLRQDFAALRDELARRNQPGADQTSKNFWQDPDARFKELREEMLQSQQTLLDSFQRSREEEFQQQALNRRREEAAEFIRTQKGYDQQDDEELADIIRENYREGVDPMMLAKYAWYELNAQRGVGDRGQLKRQAAGIQGQPPGVGLGRKVWSRQEFDQALDLIEKDRHNPKYDELFKELDLAQREGRVK